MKKTVKVLALSFALMLGVGFSACAKPNTDDGSDSTGGGSNNPPAQKTQLAAPQNVIVDDEYKLTFDAVENATSYQISVDDGDYIDIGNVTEYDLSDKYGQAVSVRALGDESKYKNSKEVYVTLDNYSQTFIDFEGAVGTDEWSGAGYGTAKQILGTTDEKAHGGNNSFKMFIQNNAHYGGVLFDTGWYTIDNAIDWAHVKEISYSSYVDTLDLTQIQALCTEYGMTYNAEVANVESLCGAQAGGQLVLYYANEDGEASANADVYFGGQTYPVNEWYTVTMDVSKYATLTDIGVQAINSERSFGFSSEWSKPSPYCYILYLDDFTLTYNTITLAEPENLTYEDGAFVWEEVEFASGYEISTDGKEWKKIYATEYSVDIEKVSQFAVRAVNGRKYADGTARCVPSQVVFYNPEGEEVKKTPLGTTKNIKLNYDSANGYTLSWDAVENASGYGVSFDNQTWVAVDGVSCAVDIAKASDTVYVKALAYGFKYSDGEIISAKIFEEAAFDLGKMDVRLLGMSAISKVMFNNEECASYTYVSDVLTLNLADKSNVVSGKGYPLTVVTANGSYTYVAKVWDMVMSDAQELQAFMDIWKDFTAATIVEGNYCLDSDIDATGVVSENKANVFQGVWDGRGHTISNFDNTNHEGAIFCYITRTGVVRNIAFKNCTAKRAFLAYRMGGLVENVYVELALVPSTSYYGVFAQVRPYNTSDTPVIRNCVFNVTMTEAGNGYGGSLGYYYSGTIENTYIINNTNAEYIAEGTKAQKNLDALTGVKGYASVTAFLADTAVSFSSENGWSEYWKFENGVLYFGNTAVLQVAA